MIQHKQNKDLVPCSSSVVDNGDRYGRYTVLGIFKASRGYQKYALVQCDCGSQPRHVQIGVLRNGTSASCGCYHKDRVTTHGLWNSPIFGIWRNMVKRCSDPTDSRYSRYGGRGIYVAKEWLVVQTFHADMIDGFKPGLTLDRIDNDGPYCKSNCRWATRAQQNRNYSRNVVFTKDGETRCLKDWSEVSGINYGTLWDRVFVQKLTIDQALSK